jgi:6-pyruvoyltetrahydropterin/6-carboxytetrahydropterin synthase
VYAITKIFSFSASHRLTGLAPDHRCGRVHGHNYVVEIVLASAGLDECGFVVEFGELDPVRRYIDDALDHRHLNDVLPVQPSSENLARYLYDWSADNLDAPIARRLCAVRVRETASTSATYARDGDVLTSGRWSG